MANKTMTRVQAIEIAIASLADSNVPTDMEAVAVLTKIRDQFTKPRTGEKTETPAHKSNVTDAKRLYEVAPEEPFDSRFVMEHTSAMTPQKVVGIMNVGIKELGLFEKVLDGKKVKYRKL